MVDRRIPRPHDLAPLIQFKTPEWNGMKSRLAAALTIYDLRDITKHRTPKVAFDYAEGVAEAEI